MRCVPLKQAEISVKVTVIATLQNTVVEYSSLTLVYLLIVGLAAQAAGIYIFWWIQRHFKLSAKCMFFAVAVGIIFLDGWGMIGIWTQTFGFHHKWEFWLYQVSSSWNIERARLSDASQLYYGEL